MCVLDPQSLTQHVDRLWPWSSITSAFSLNRYLFLAEKAGDERRNDHDQGEPEDDPRPKGRAAFAVYGVA
jgi:hypothetical protein